MVGASDNNIVRVATPICYLMMVLRQRGISPIVPELVSLINNTTAPSAEVPMSSTSTKLPPKKRNRASLAELSTNDEGIPFAKKTRYVLQRAEENLKVVQRALKKEGENSLEDVLRCLVLLDWRKKGAFFVDIVRELFGVVLEEEGITGVNELVPGLMMDIMEAHEVAHWIVC